MDSIEDKVKAIISGHLGKKDIKGEDLIIADLGADSLDIVELSMAFEDEFDLHISDEQLDKINTVDDAIAVVRSSSKNRL